MEVPSDSRWAYFLHSASKVGLPVQKVADPYSFPRNGGGPYFLLSPFLSVVIQMVHGIYIIIYIYLWFTGGGFVPTDIDKARQVGASMYIDTLGRSVFKRDPQTNGFEQRKPP